MCVNVFTKVFSERVSPIKSYYPIIIFPWRLMTTRRLWWLGTHFSPKSSATIHTRHTAVPLLRKRDQTLNLNNSNNSSANLPSLPPRWKKNPRLDILDIIASLTAGERVWRMPSLSKTDAGFTFLFVGT